MARFEYESLGLFRPEFADELVRHEAFERLQSACKMICGDEVGEMRSQLGVGFIEGAFDRGVLDCAVHALNLPIGPRMFGLGQPVVDIGAGAGMLERMRPERLPLHQHFLDFDRGPGLAAGIGEVFAIVGQHCVDFVGNDLDQREQEIGGNARRRLFMQLDESKFRRAVDRHEHVELVFGRANFGNVDMEIADWIGFEFPLGGDFYLSRSRPFVAIWVGSP